MEATRLYLLDAKQLQEEKTFEEYFSTVSKYRQDKVMRLRFPKDRALSLGAGLLIDRGLKEYGLNERDMEYVLGDKEKPFFANFPDIHFNVSHSGRYVICAFAPCAVGCDIEEVSDIDLKIAKRFFSPSECEEIAGLKSYFAKQQLFYRLWTLKESFLKITGAGMSLPLDEFSIEVNEAPIRVRQNIDAQPYHFHEYDCAQGYKIAVCSHVDGFAEAVVVELGSS